MANKFSALLVDDEYSATNLLEKLLRKTKEFNSIHSTEKPEEAISLFNQYEPDILFLDIEMPLLNGFELLEKIMENGHQTQVVFVTAYSEYALQAIKVSCLDYILKPPTIEDINEVLKRVKEKFFSDSTIEKIHINKLRFFQKHYKEFQLLTDREKEILTLVAQGKTNKEIGRELFISPFTVKTHRKNIHKKLGTNTAQKFMHFKEVFLGE